MNPRWSDDRLVVVVAAEEAQNDSWMVDSVEEEKRDSATFPKDSEHSKAEALAASMIEKQQQ